MDFFKTLAMVGLVGVASLTTLDAETIEFTISPTVRGLGTNPVLNFKIDGEILSGSIPISQGSRLVDQSAQGFANPLDAVVFITWLQQTGRFDEYRTFINNFTTVANADQKMWNLMNSDQILLQQQQTLKRCSVIRPLLLINGAEGIKTLVYVVEGEKLKVVYPLPFKKERSICRFSLLNLGHDNDSNIITALIEQYGMNHQECIEYHTVRP